MIAQRRLPIPKSWDWKPSYLVLHGILGEEQLGGASADAQSYWQGHALPAPLLSAFEMLVALGTVGALPQTPQGTLSLDPARGNCPLTPFRD